MGFSMIRARYLDALDIWDNAPQPAPKFCWLRVKASICIFLGLEASWLNIHADHVPVWASPQHIGYGYDGPTCDWSEVAVAPGLLRWQYSRYTNGF